LGGGYIRRGNLSRAVQYCRQSIAGYQQIDDIVGQAKAHNNLGIALKSLGEWQQARDAFHKSLDIDREIGDVQERGLVTNNLGNIALDCGEWAEAAALYQESNAIWVQLGAALPEAVTLSNLAQVHIYQGDWQAARDCLNRSRDIFERIGSDHFMPELERRWGELALRTGALEEAVAHAQRSIELAMNQETRVEEGMSLRLLGETYLARGDAFAAPAESVLRHSLNILQALNSGYEAAKTALTLTRSISHAKREEAVIHLAYATQAFEALGAQADLERAIALAAEMGL
jgi:tetratricopeptide (TPR) repeat protein